MHWLFLLALLSSATDLKGGGSTSSLNRVAENSLRRQLGTVRNIRVQVAPGNSRTRGDFNSFDVSLDGFSADRLMSLSNQSGNNNSSSRDRDPYPSRDDDAYPSPNGDSYPSPDDPNSFPSTDRFPDSSSSDGFPDYGFPNSNASRRNNIDAGDIGDILGGIGGGKLGGVLGDILGGGGKSGGRIGRIRLHATNFSFQGTRYDALSADMGEIRFDWSKALRGQFDIQSIAPGSLSLNLRGDQVARLLAPKLPSLSNVRVRFANGRAFVGAKSDLYGVRVPFEVGARLSVQQNRVIASDFAASVARLRLPSFVLKELTRGVNPLYDFDPQNRWPLAVNLSTAQANSDVLAMRGGIQWLGLNRNRRTRNQSDYPDNRDDNRRYPDNNNRYPDDNFPNQNDDRDDSNRDDRNRDDRNRGSELPDILGGIFGR